MNYKYLKDTQVGKSLLWKAIKPENGNCEKIDLTS